MTLFDEEDKVAVPVAEGFNELFKLLVDYMVNFQDRSKLVGTFTPDSRIVLLSRIYALDKAFLGMA